MRKLWPAWLMIALSATFTAVMYHRLPEQVVSHWGSDGTPNGWTSRFIFAVGIHCVAIAVAVILAFAPTFDPKRDNFPSHEAAYWAVANGVIAVVAFGAGLVVAFNAGWNVRIEWIGYAIGMLFITLGNVSTRIRPNWIFGVRTPWTLSSDRSWRAAHRVAGYGMALVGLATIIVTAIRPGALKFVLVPGVLIVSLASVLRSYFVWKQDSSTLHTQ